jgi:hypothetical protein
MAMSPAKILVHIPIQTFTRKFLYNKKLLCRLSFVVVMVTLKVIYYSHSQGSQQRMSNQDFEIHIQIEKK